MSNKEKENRKDKEMQRLSNFMAGKERFYSPAITHEHFETGIQVKNIDDIAVYIDENVIRICKAVAKAIEGDTEFSILFKGTISDGSFIVGSEYYIPKQSVGTASVDYSEDLAQYRAQGYNVVLHKHPNNIKSFSSSDYNSINSNFDCSILYCGGDITDATLKFKISDKFFIIIKVKNIYIVDNTIISVENVDNIEKKKYVTTVTADDGIYGYYNDYGIGYNPSEYYYGIYGKTGKEVNTGKSAYDQYIKEKKAEKEGEYNYYTQNEAVKKINEEKVKKLQDMVVKKDDDKSDSTK